MRSDAQAKGVLRMWLFLILGLLVFALLYLLTQAIGRS
jgi:hypothetical protein